MKKILLSITALTFGASVAFAQTETGIQEEPQKEDLQIEKLSNTVEAESKKKIEKGELPAVVLEAFQESEFKDWEVTEIYEVEGSTASETDMPATSQEASYEIVLISQDMKDEIKDTQEAAMEEKEDALEDGEAAEISTEKVKVEVPAVLLKYNTQGQLIEQKELKSDADQD